MGFHVKDLGHSIGRLLTGNSSFVSTLHELSGEVPAAKQGPVQVEETQELQLPSHWRFDGEKISDEDSSSGHRRCSTIEI
jgi:hypothetical protein